MQLAFLAVLAACTLAPHSSKAHSRTTKACFLACLATTALLSQAATGLVFETHVVTKTLDYANSVYAADLDGDGDLDIISTAANDNQVAWYRNAGSGSFPIANKVIISSSSISAWNAMAADLDGDGDMDVLAASNGDNTVAWFRNNGAGVFGPRLVISTTVIGIKCAHARDLDGDGDVDVAAAVETDNNFVWFRNNGTGSFGPKIILSSVTYGAQWVASADLNGDARIDLLLVSIGDSTVGWFNNLGGGSFTARIVLGTANFPTGIYAADLDGDADNDVISCSQYDNTVGWYRNTNGLGAFTARIALTTDASSAQAVFAIDMDADGDIDVLSASGNDNIIAWYRNYGNGTFTPKLTIVSDAISAKGLFAADVDGDGPIDALSASRTDGKIAWYRNVPRGLASRTTASWESSYVVGTSNSIGVVSRDLLNRTGSACDVTAVLSGASDGYFVGQFANSVSPAAGYAIPFNLPVNGSYNMQLLVDGVPSGLAISFVGTPPPPICAGETVLLSGVCAVCPEGSSKGAMGNTLACVCVTGRYVVNNTASPFGIACVLCPPGAICAGGGAQPTAAPGFYPTDGVFVACPNSRACVGGGACAKGYTGRLCGACTRNYYSLNGRCYRCNRAQTAAIALLVVVVALMVAALLLWFNLSGHSHRFVAAMIGLQALQLSAMFGKLELDWGPFASAYFNVISALNVNWQLTSPECSVTPSVDAWTLTWILTMMLPVFAAVALVIVAGPFLLCKFTLTSLLDGVWRSWVQTVALLYLPLTAGAFSLFGCRRDVSGRWILIARPSRLCYDSAWWGMFAPALVLSIVYGLALPGVLFGLLAVARRRMTELQFNLRFGFMVGRFSDSFWFFESANMATKLGVVVCMTFFYTDGGRASGAVLVLAAAALAVSRTSPYRTRFHNALAIGVTSATAAVLFGGTITDFTLRRVVVLGGIAATVVGVVVGNCIELALLAAGDRVAEGYFKEAAASAAPAAEASSRQDLPMSHARKDSRPVSRHSGLDTVDDICDLSSSRMDDTYLASLATVQ